MKATVKTFLALTATALTACGSKDSKPKFTKSEALAHSQVCVTQYLKSPGSADFAYQPDETIKQLNDSTFEILSYVDSQNDFGAMKRTYYKCKVIFNNKGEADCQDMQIEEKK